MLVANTCHIVRFCTYASQSDIVVVVVYVALLAPTVTVAVSVVAYVALASPAVTVVVSVAIAAVSVSVSVTVW